MVVNGNDQGLVFPQTANHAEYIKIAPAIGLFGEVLQQALNCRVSVYALVVADLFKDLIVGCFIAVASEIITEHQIVISQQTEDALLIRIVVAYQPDLIITSAHHLFQGILHTVLAILFLDVKQ